MYKTETNYHLSNMLGICVKMAAYTATCRTTVKYSIVMISKLCVLGCLYCYLILMIQCNVTIKTEECFCVYIFFFMFSLCIFKSITFIF